MMTMLIAYVIEAAQRKRCTTESATIKPICQHELSKVCGAEGRRRSFLCLFLSIVLGAFPVVSAGEKFTNIDVSTTTHHPAQKPGCGLQSGAPLWIPYTKLDEIHLWRIQSCVERLTFFYDNMGGQMAEMIPSSLVKHTKMDCHDQTAERDTMKHHFHNITFFGDTMLYQQYLTLLCSVQPTLQQLPIQQEAVRGQRPHYLQYQLPENDDGEQKNTTTIIRYVPYSIGWGPKIKNAFEEHFRKALKSCSSSKDAIVLNGGLFLNVSMSTDIVRYHDYLNYIMNQIATTATKCSVFFIETVHQEWPTTNGEESHSCAWKTYFTYSQNNNNNTISRQQQREGVCQVSDPYRRMGQGPVQDCAIHDVGRFENNVVSQLDPQVSKHLSTRDQTTVAAASCVPTCWSARWRNDFVRSHFAAFKKIQIVPLFDALALQKNGLQARSRHDCSHKSSAILWEMNQQLLRVMVPSGNK